MRRWSLLRDPEPGNIAGEKVERHVFKHQINWGYVVLGLAGLYAVYRLGQLLDGADDEGKNQDPAVSTEV
jgi:hypothetical protein